MEERPLCAQVRCCHCIYRSFRVRPRLSLWRTFLSVTCLIPLLTHTAHAQDQYTFTTEPQSYYYIRAGEFQDIPCAAEVTRNNGNVEPVSPALYINSEPLDIYDITNTRITAHLTRGVVVGILVFSALPTDHLTQFQCVLGDNQTVTSMLYVGDGTPLKPLSNPVQVAETVHSITVDWGKAPTPSFAPILFYKIELVELLEVERALPPFEARSNNTNAEVTGLIAGTMYRITVLGVNSLGEGQRSDYVVGRTDDSLVPLPPTEVTVVVQNRGAVSDVILSWTPAPIDRDAMTPITHFIIYYGRDESSLVNYTTADGLVTHYNMSGWSEEGEWLVGVASFNSAGASSTVYRNFVIEPTTGLPTQSTPTQTGSTVTPQKASPTLERPSSGSAPIDLNLIVGGAVGGFVIIIVILIFLIIIFMVRYRIKRLNHEEHAQFNVPRSTETPIDELDGSPSSVKRKSPSPKHIRESDCSFSSNELRSYVSEPKRAGSRTPPPNV